MKGLEAYKAESFEVHGYVADVTDEKQIAEMVKKINREVGIIDILVNNAGVIKRMSSIPWISDKIQQNLFFLKSVNSAYQFITYIFRLTHF